MTTREKEFAELGFETAANIEQQAVVFVPTTGREIRKNKHGKWECQPWNDNYWREFDDLLDAAKFASRPIR